MWCFPERKDRDEGDQVDVWCFPERKDRDEDDQGKCGVSLKERHG